MCQQCRGGPSLRLLLRVAASMATLLVSLGCALSTPPSGVPKEVPIPAPTLIVRPTSGTRASDTTRIPIPGVTLEVRPASTPTVPGAKIKEVPIPGPTLTWRVGGWASARIWHRSTLTFSILRPSRPLAPRPSLPVMWPAPQSV